MTCRDATLCGAILLLLLAAPPTLAQEGDASLDVPSPQRLPDEGLDAIEVARVGLDVAGWLVVHPEAPRGGPATDEVLGTAHVDPGTHEDIEVPLDEPLRENVTLFVVLYKDEAPEGEYGANDPPAMRGDEVLLETVEVRAREAAGAEPEREDEATHALGPVGTVAALVALAWVRSRRPR